MNKYSKDKIYYLHNIFSILHVYMQTKEFQMDHKQLIGFTESQRYTIAEAARRAGLSFTAYVRSSAILRAAESGLDVQPPQVD